VRIRDFCRLAARHKKMKQDDEEIREETKNNNKNKIKITTTRAQTTN
jgi:hypothetical protein